MHKIPTKHTNDFSLYFHIPFCTKKCDYCHFYVLPNKEHFHELLMEGLFLEMDLWKNQLAHKNLISIYFGGGTPSLLGPKRLKRILDHIQTFLPFTHLNIEITLEANPENITLELMQAYAEAGINRVSIGIQSLDDSLLKTLGRTHSSKESIDAILLTHHAGIENISIDLMYDIPMQTLKTWKHTLSQVSNLPITHLSLYNLTIEPHTVFFKYREKLQKLLPDADCSTEMYKSALVAFKASGFNQYEISAFAQNSLYSRHNIGYWIGRPFLGFGPSAFSYWEGRRFRSIANINRYIDALRKKNSPEDFSEKLTRSQSRCELLAIGLRLCQGICQTAFEAEYGLLEQETLTSLKKLESQGFLLWEKKKDIIALTEHGVLFYDTVASELIQ